MRKEKQLLLDEIKDQIDVSDSFVILSYEALKANAANQFRVDVANTGGSIEMVRKRVFAKACQAAGIEMDIATLPGHIGLVFAGEDPLQTTKAVFDFRKSYKDNIEVLGGRFDGELCSGEVMLKLSQLPGKDEMRAQLLSVFEAPMSQTLAVMQALLSSVVNCLDQKAKQGDQDQ